MRAASCEQKINKFKKNNNKIHVSSLKYRKKGLPESARARSASNARREPLLARHAIPLSSPRNGRKDCVTKRRSGREATVFNECSTLISKKKKLAVNPSR